MESSQVLTSLSIKDNSKQIKNMAKVNMYGQPANYGMVVGLKVACMEKVSLLEAIRKKNIIFMTKVRNKEN